jgi:gliding motility-associated-like protein
VNIVLPGGAWEVNEQLNLVAGTSKIRFLIDDFNSVNGFKGASKVYHDVIFLNGANITGNNSFNNLMFGPGHAYTIQSGSTQNIQGVFAARGCSGLIEIKASGGSQAIISKNNGSVNVSYVTLESISANLAAGNQFNAYQSIDLGNNSNINIVPDGRDMYWINGSGNWSDTVHWTSSQGGPDADCVPVMFDNVNFDENSFVDEDTVFVDAKNAYCKNMTWSGSDSPYFQTGNISNNLFIYGSLQFTESMTNLYNGRIFFKDVPYGKTIDPASQYFFNDLIFDGIGGSWTMEDSLKVEGSIYLYHGGLNTNDQFVSCYTFHSDSAHVRTIELGKSEIEVVKNYPYPAWSVNNEELEFDGGESSIKLLLSSSRFYNYGGDTLKYNNLEMTGDKGLGLLDTGAETYAEFNIVDFKSNAKVNGNNLFDSIYFSPGNYYELASGTNQTVLSSVITSGVCEGPILLRSATHGNQANIIKAQDTLKLFFTSIQDINVTGGAVFIAENSTDLGNNIGWDTIQSTAPGKLFWVGGEGEWSDMSNWSLESNGIGGECIPTPYDTVIFDEFSFFDADQYVWVDLNNAFSHNFIWRDAQFQPSLQGPSSSNLFVFGTMDLLPDLKFDFEGPIYFEATNPGQTITTKNVKFHNSANNVFFSGLGGEWTLMDTLDIGASDENKNTIYHHYGSLITNNQYVNCFDFKANSIGERNIQLDSSLIEIKNDWYVVGSNMTMVGNNSLIRIDSGEFTQFNGAYFPYNDILLASEDQYQSITTRSADTILFNNIHFNNDGEIAGNNCLVQADHIHFRGSGKVNTAFSLSENIYIVDTLLFEGIGNIFGNDTINFVQFDSLAYIEGNGVYKDAVLFNDGEIYLNNSFDTLTFSPGYVYQLEGNSTQLINDEFNVKGNNCQPIWLQSTNGSHAIVHKDTAEVIGDFIEMNVIRATGNAVFNAGRFSTDINNSNEGWIFENSDSNYELGEDISFVEGDTLYLCTENFNGNSGTSYIWQNCETGEVVGTDSCLMVTHNGYYCLTVNYTDGMGCTKYDTIYVSCELALTTQATNVSCFGYGNGAVMTEVGTGLEPLDVFWSYNDVPFDTTLNINNLEPGAYTLIIEDDYGCVSYDTIEIFQPDTLILAVETLQSCYNENSGSLSINIEGGMAPYNILWSNDSTTAAISDLEPGIYGVLVSDSNNCPAELSNLIVEELDQLTFDLLGNELLCFGDSSGIINIVNLTGGSGEYSFYETIGAGDTLQGGPLIDSLTSGTYLVNVYDDQGCSAQNSIILSEPEEIILTIDSHDGTIYYGLIDLTVEGGIGPYEYLWSNGATTEDLDPLAGGLYSVIVTDENGCEKSDEIFVEVSYRVLAPTAFSPNSDGLNEEFLIQGIGTNLESIELTIYNRWGEVVFVTNDISSGWNGKMDNTGQMLPEEVYTWTISYTLRNGQSRFEKGNLTLLR